MKAQPFVKLVLTSFVGFTLFGFAASAAETKTNSTVRFYRLSQLDEARKRAAAEDKPIAWIASKPEYLYAHKNPLGKGTHAATAYAVRALMKETVMVFSDAFTENHQEPPIVDQALHSPNSHYNVPGVIILTPDLGKVIAKAFYIEDSQGRIKAFTEILEKIRNKDAWKLKPNADKKAAS